MNQESKISLGGKSLLMVSHGLAVKLSTRASLFRAWLGKDLLPMYVNPDKPQFFAMCASSYTPRVSLQDGSKLLPGQVIQEKVEKGGKGGEREKEREKENSKCKAAVFLGSNSEEATYHFSHILFSGNES